MSWFGRIRFFLFLTLASVSFAQAAPRQLDVSIADEQPVRLSQLVLSLVDTQVKETPYWPAAGFGRKDAIARIQQKKAQLLALIAQHQNAMPDEAGQLSSLKEQMAALHLRSREFRLIDPDHIRLDPRLDPLLRGEFRFYFPARPHQVQVLGAIEAPTVLEYQAGQFTARYLDGIRFQAIAQQGEAYVIQPNGDVEKARVGYWLKPNVIPKPGATIYIAQELAPELTEQVIELLTYQAAWWSTAQ